MKAKKLKIGDTVAIIAPASPYKYDDYDRIKKNIELLGLVPVLLPTCYLKHGHFAGTDQERLDDIHNAFSNNLYKAIICLKGGYGTPRLLKGLDIDLIEKNFKIFLGYSDITGIHITLNNKGLVTFHGPMASSDFKDDYTINHLKSCLLNDQKLIIKNPINEKIETLVPGKCTGKIVGGNLSLLVSTLGSPFEIDTKDKILFIEEINEPIYKIDRMLNSLEISGKFEDAVGIILGTFSGCKSDTMKIDLSLTDVIKELIVPYNKPTISNFRAGHNFPQATIPFNVTATLDTSIDGLYFIESAVKS